MLAAQNYHRRLVEKPPRPVLVLRVPCRRQVESFEAGVCFFYKMAFNGDGPHNKRQRTDTDPANNRVSTPGEERVVAPQEIARRYRWGWLAPCAFFIDQEPAAT